MNLQERIEKMEKELAELKASVVTQSVEWPVEDDSYWTVQAHGAVTNHRFCNDEFDCGILQLGNIFRTEEEAVREVERRKVLTQLRKLAKAAWGNVKCDFSNIGQKKHCLGFRGGYWQTEYGLNTAITCTIYFPTKESAIAALETIGADRMMLLLED